MGEGAGWFVFLEAVNTVLDKRCKKFALIFQVVRKGQLFYDSSNETSGTFSHVPQTVFLASLSTHSLFGDDGVCALDLACRLPPRQKKRICSQKSPRPDNLKRATNAQQPAAPPLILCCFSSCPTHPTPTPSSVLTTRTPKCASTSRPSG